MQYLTSKTQDLRRNILFGLFTVGLFLASPCLILAAPGDLDPTFGNGGVVVTSFTSSPYTDFPSSVRMQTDGKIIVCGQIGQYDASSGDSIIVSFFIARYLASGELDMSFGTNGKIIAPIDSGDELVGEDIALQPDGKIVAVGYKLITGSGGYFAVNRYNPDGTLDASFGTGGKVTTQIGDGSCSPFVSNACVNSVAVQPDGKIVVVGYANHGFAVVRYNPNGTLDTGFGMGGKIITHLLAYSRAEAVMTQSDGKVVVAGSTNDGSGGYSGRFALVRYNEDGSLDPSFGVGGSVIQMFPNASAYLNDAVLQPDGRIVVVGSILSASTAAMAIIRYNANGSIDTSFASNGIFTSPNTIFSGGGIALQPDGKIVAFGSYYYARSAVLRLHPNGSLDTGFGPNGVASTNFFDGTSYGVAGAIQPNGGILFLGYTWTGPSEIVLARFRGDPIVGSGTTADFDGDGRSDISVFRPTDGFWYLDRSTAGFSAAQFGLATDKITPADYDGDGKTDIAVYRSGTWYRLDSADGSFQAVQFGLAADIAVPADYTGDGRAELAIFRGGQWWTLDLSNNGSSLVNFGSPGDMPVPADYDGDGRADQAVYREGIWYLNRSSEGSTAIPFGLPTDTPVVADYNGDGRADPAVYRDGTWHLLISGQGFTSVQWGLATDMPAPADYDGDGKTDIAIFRDGIWYLLKSTAGFSAVQFGLIEDKPIPSAFVP